MYDAVTLAQQLVRMDTRGGAEKPAAAFLATLLEDAGFAVRVDEPEAGRANLVAVRGSGTPITLTGHLDTVPADASGWSFDPLSGEIHGGRLRGRGSSDMKAGVAGIVCAATRHAAHSPGTAVQLVFTFGEETGCEGAAALDGLAPSPALLVAEPTANRVVLGHKGALWLRLTAHGRSAHGSRPELGDNALVKLAAAAQRIHEHGDWPHSATHGAATVNVGTFHAGIQPNLVPDRAELTLDVRTVPGFSSADAVAEIRRVVRQCAAEEGAAEVTVERILDLPSVATDPGDALARELTGVLVPGAAPAAGGQEPCCATYFTDASVLAGKLGGPAVLLYGPGEPEQAHVTDESCSVAAVHASAEALERLLARWHERAGGRREG
ncbi:M20 family metallopeptidase [Streptomyces pinistramenti]|uniref:M20 family metallopeptidase n=1 Tax=Streptomyces pinistramenti TaxID=2884812 RepID=UPI001D081E74|nr:M20 family metallopeptidase [Streptomyces pinistramenti]MCB5905944.1 M20 family metallopeptidase [Streptomyces pinistramenti]